MRLGDEQPRRAARRAGAKPASLYQLHGPEASVVHRRRDRDAQNAASDHQHVGTRIGDRAGISAKDGALISR